MGRDLLGTITPREGSFAKIAARDPGAGHNWPETCVPNNTGALKILYRQGNTVNTADAVRLIGFLQEVAEKQPSDALHAGIASVMERVRPCVPADQVQSFDSFCRSPAYREFFQRMEACREELA
jgi:hypothetical protein